MSEPDYAKATPDKPDSREATPGKAADEASLAAAFAAGDRDAFTTLYEAYVRRIYDYVYYRTHHRMTAEDITQQVFVNVLERIGSYDVSRGAFSAWIYAIARNAVIDHYRALKPEQPIEDAWDVPDGTDVQRDADTALRVEAVQKVLKTLNPRQREIVLLRLWHGYSFAEIAAIVGTNENAAKVAFHRAVKSVRADLLIFLLYFFFQS